MLFASCFILFFTKISHYFSPLLLVIIRSFVFYLYVNPKNRTFCRLFYVFIENVQNYHSLCNKIYATNYKRL